METKVAEQGETVYGTLKGRTGWWKVEGDDWVPAAAPEKVNGKLVR